MSVVKYKSKVSKVLNRMAKEDTRLLAVAGRHVQKKVRAKLSSRQTSQPNDPPGLNTGNLKEGIKVIRGKDAVRVGAVAPAYHAPLLEFGTRNRTTKTGKPNPMEPRPFLYPTFEEEKDEIIRILSEKRI